MQTVNRLLYNRLSPFWDQQLLAELFEKVRQNFTAYENGTHEEIEAGIDEDDELLETVLEEEEAEVRARTGVDGQVNHNACATCQQEEASGACYASVHVLLP
jgi:hypothetical protein